MATWDNRIYVQQNNARPRCVLDDVELLGACCFNGYGIKIITNSPDTNIMDLEFFVSIQSLQDRTRSRTIDDLIKEVYLAGGPG